MKLKIIFTTILFVVIYIVFSINRNKNVVIHNYQSIKRGIWMADKPLRYSFNIANASKPYNIYLSIRHKNRYNYENCWFFIHTTNPLGTVQTDTVNVTMANPMGKWLGKGATSTKTLTYLYKEKYYFTYAGNYSVSITHGMRPNNLVGITNMGFRVVAVKRGALPSIN